MGRAVLGIDYSNCKNMCRIGIDKGEHSQAGQDSCIDESGYQRTLTYSGFTILHTAPSLLPNMSHKHQLYV